MADRITGRVATITADLPGLTTETVTLTITDPYGVELVGDAATTGNGYGRYSYTTETALTVPGEWSAEWVESSVVVRTDYFSVGPRLGYARSLADTRIDVARRVVTVYEGFVLDAEEKAVSDPGLIGGAGNYQGFWYVPDPDGDDRGRAFLVETFNGNSLELSHEFWTVPSENDRFFLMDAHPREVTRAINVAVQDLLPLSRIQMTLPSIAIPTDGLIDLPLNVSHVYEVWVEDDDEGLVRLAQNLWDTKPGRRVFIDSEADNATIGVLAHASVPRWEDSLIDLDPAPVISRAAHLLHANRASSSTTDLDEHLRRQLAARDEYEQSKRSSVGRIPPGARKIID